MLVLTRRAGESIMIDGQIELKVLRIKGSQVHIGIEAPRETAIHRKEVWVRLQDVEEDGDVDGDALSTAPVAHSVA